MTEKLNSDIGTVTESYEGETLLTVHLALAKWSGRLDR